MRPSEVNDVTGRVIGAAFEVHTVLGPGLPEGVYQDALAIEMRLRGLSFVGQPALPATYKGHPLRRYYRPDFIVEGSVVLELKVVEAVHDVHVAQLLAYLRMSGCPAGLLLNFDVARMRHGVHRVALDPGSFPSPSAPSASSAL